LNTSKGGLNFPISLKTNAYPYVKSLDVNGLPIADSAALEDMKEYVSIKKAIDANDFKGALKNIESAEKYHPNSIFFSDYEFLRLKALMGLASSEGWVATVASAKEWLKNYATDEKTPEVLFLLANAYAAMQDSKNAEYYYKLLMEDYSQLEISKKAMLSLADLKVKGQNYKPALSLYRSVLYSTQDLDTASAAAYKATETYLTIKEPDGAREYFSKLIKGNLSYALQNKGKAFELANRLAGAEIYKEAIELGEALLNNMDKSDPNYAKLIYLIATWYDKSGNIESAKQYYMRYLSEFSGGINAKDAQNRLDAIVFAQTKPEDENAVKVYNDTIKKYQGDDIAKRALAQKAGVLYKAGRCEEYLQDLAEISKLPKDLLPNEAKMTLECKQKVAFGKLANADCKSALEMIDTNKLVVPSEYSQPLFNCYLEQTRFKDAINLSYNEAKKGTGKDRLTWLANYEKALLTKQDYKVAIAVAADAIKLANALNINGFEWLWIDKFNAAYYINDIKSMLESIEMIEKIYGNDPKAIEPYRKMVEYGIKKSDDLIIQNYAKKLIALQTKTGIKTETPWIEFTYAESLSKTGDARGALNALNSLAKAKLSPEQNARRLYVSSIYQLKLGLKAEALKNLQTCASFKDGGAWTKLCVDGAELAK
ncbi:MAG: hypothetical protein RL154_375, partial [Pseudomonadota bacterium]